jgi:hypothetical protein
VVGSDCSYILVDIIARLCYIPEHVLCLQRWNRFTVEWDGYLGFSRGTVALCSPKCPNVSTGPLPGAPCYSKICGATHGHIFRFWIGWTAVIIGGLGMLLRVRLKGGIVLISFWPRKKFAEWASYGVLKKL